MNGKPIPPRERRMLLWIVLFALLLATIDYLMGRFGARILHRMIFLVSVILVMYVVKFAIYIKSRNSDP